MITVILLDTSSTDRNIALAEFHILARQADLAGHTVISYWSTDRLLSFIEIDDELTAIKFKLEYM